MKRVNVISGLLLIGIASTISTTPTKASTTNTTIVTETTKKESQQVSWEKVRDYFGYDHLYTKYHEEDTFNKYLEKEKEENERVKIFFNNINMMEKKVQYKINKQKKLIKQRARAEWERIQHTTTK